MLSTTSPKKQISSNTDNQMTQPPSLPTTPSRSSSLGIPAKTGPGSLLIMSRISRAALALAVVIGITDAHGQSSTSYTGFSGNSWFTAGNWSAGVPNRTRDAYIYGNSVQYRSGIANAANLYLGYNSVPGALNMDADGSGALEMHATDLYVGYNAGGYGTLSMTGRSSDKFATTNAHLGYESGSYGAAGVSGVFLFNGITWANSESLNVGYSGEGELVVNAFGGVMSSTTSHAGARYRLPLMLASSAALLPALSQSGRNWS